MAAESEISNYAAYMGEGVEEDINSKIRDLRTAITNGDVALIQQAMDALANSLASYSSESQSDGRSEKSGVVTAADNAISIADGIIRDYEGKLASGVMDELKLKTGLLRDALGDNDERKLKSAFDTLISLLQKIKEYTPQIQPSITIQCASEIEVGKVLGCSSSHDRVPDQTTWSAPGGDPSEGTGETFQTSYPTTGEISISVEACIGSVCVTDVQVLTVIPKP